MAEKKCGRAMGSTKASEGRKTEPASGRVERWAWNRDEVRDGIWVFAKHKVNRITWNLMLQPSTELK